MAITFVGAIGGYSPNNSSPYTINRPSGASDSDVLVMIAAMDANNSVPIVPDGWVVRGAGHWRSFGRQFFVAHRAIPDIGTEPASYTIGKPGSGTVIVAIYCYRGVDTSNPFATSGDEQKWVESASSLTVPSITTTTDSAMALGLSIVQKSAPYPTPSISGATVREGYSWVISHHALDWAVPVEGGIGSVTVNYGATATFLCVYLTALRPASGDPPGPTRRFWSFAQIVE